MAGRMRNRASAALAALTAGIALGACERQSPAGAGGMDGGAGAGPTAGAAASAGAAGAPTAAVPGDGATRADAIRAGAGSWPKAEGRWNAGGIDSRFVAHFQDGELRYLEEFVTVPAGAPHENRYWFEDGALFYYRGERAPGAAAGGGPEAMAGRVPVVAEFAGTQVVRAFSREHHGEKKLDEAAIVGIRRHALALAGAAQDEWSAAQLQ